MNNVKKIGLLLLISGLITGFAQAAEKPDATLRVSGGSFALGIGVNWGSGTLTYKGKAYPVKVKGLSVGKVGMTNSSAYGEVFNLKHLQDFNGHYDVGGAGTRGVASVIRTRLIVPRRNARRCRAHLDPQRPRA